MRTFFKRTFFKTAPLLFVVPILSLSQLFQLTDVQHESLFLTPTYDPLVEPPIPEDPTEYELGRNLYWHWCMTCHGDRGQGLTDEFRLIWEPEHQNCWGRGCHAGRSEDGGFPIPTVVPPLVNDGHLAQFTSVQELSEFLKATHPPQSPGILKDEEYHAIAVFVFTMNGRLRNEASITYTPTLTSTPALVISQRRAPNPLIIITVIILSTFVMGVLALKRRAHGLK